MHRLETMMAEYLHTKLDISKFQLPNHSVIIRNSIYLEFYSKVRSLLEITIK